MDLAIISFTHTSKWCQEQTSKVNLFHDQPSTSAHSVIPLTFTTASNESNGMIAISCMPIMHMPAMLI